MKRSRKKPIMLDPSPLDKYTPILGRIEEVPSGAKTSMEDEVARERKIKNDDAEQDIALKRKTLDRLFILLAAETVAVFTLALFQGTKWFGFAMQEWSFNLLLSATIVQITAMLYVAVNYLFPKNKD